jgi:stress response protein YsnF
VNEVLAEERVEVDRVPIGKEVTSMPQVRVEGDTLIIPVVEERLVLERRLVVKEELHVKRIRSERKHRETVMLRKQEAVITRLPAEKTATSKSAELESKCK